MTFWLIAALLTLCACLAVLWPLSRPRAAVADGCNDLRVYRDQLDEVDRDLARGAIRPDDAEQARTEIGRRILRLAGTADAVAVAPRQTGAFRAVSLAAVLAVPLISWGLYALVGSPELQSQPLSARLNKPPAESTAEELIARAEVHLAKNPNDGRGWDVLAPTYLRLGRPADAIVAFRNAIRIEGETAERVGGLAEAMTVANGGIVSADAEAAFKRALALEPKFPKAVFFLALGQAQGGGKDTAVAAWKAMLSDPALPPAWKRATEYALEQAGATASAPGPSPAEVDAAKNMSPGERAAMIKKMVAGLDDKLRSQPNDPEGWIRLVRSYVVLGRPDQARDAARRALAALGNDSDGGKAIAAFAAEQGVSVTE